MSYSPILLLFHGWQFFANNVVSLLWWLDLGHPVQCSCHPKTQWLDVASPTTITTTTLCDVVEHIPQMLVLILPTLIGVAICTLFSLTQEI
jgi:hypothetical protein